MQGPRGQEWGKLVGGEPRALPKEKVYLGTPGGGPARSHREDVFPRTGKACDVLSDFQGGGWRRPWLQPGGV